MFLLNIHKIIARLYVFNSTEVRTEALQIFCVMIPFFALFRVMRPYQMQRNSICEGNFELYYII